MVGSGVASNACTDANHCFAYHIIANEIEKSCIEAAIHESPEPNIPPFPCPYELWQSLYNRVTTIRLSLTASVGNASTIGTALHSPHHYIATNSLISILCSLLANNDLIS